MMSMKERDGFRLHFSPQTVLMAQHFLGAGSEGAVIEKNHPWVQQPVLAER
jgi:hypothetical protein